MAEKNGENGNGDLKRTLVNSVLELEEIDVNLFRGSNLWTPENGRAVFGGQVVGQALVAASKTKLPGYHVHSLHCYFIKPGRSDTPILYHIDRTRDGVSFLNRTVSAVQKGDTILSMLVSFHRHEPLPISHQVEMPVTPSPDQLMTTDELIRHFIDEVDISDRLKNRLTKVLAIDIPIEMKPVDPIAYVQRRYNRKYEAKGKPGDKVLLWIRARGNVGEEDHNLHRCIAAYISDWSLLSTALATHHGFKIKMMASLDHSMWFHTNFRGDEWMLYESESPRLRERRNINSFPSQFDKVFCDWSLTVDGRALVLGRLWKQDGTLAVSVSQEGVIRGTVATEAKL